MVRTILKAVLLVQFLCLVAEVAGQSPCPNYFRYVRDDGNNEIMGLIEIPSPPKGIALHLSVGMSVAVALPTKYVGRLELAQSREESVRAVQQGRPLQYRIHFPLPHPIPALTGLWFNNQQICSGPRALGTVVTSIVLNHTLYPPGVIPLSEGQGNVIPTESKSDPQPTTQPYPQLVPQFTPQPVSRPPPQPVSRPPPQSVTGPPPQPVTRPSTNVVSSDKPRPQFGGDNVFFDPNQYTGQDCGRSSNVNSLNLLIARGTKTSPGQWPWLVAIFIVKFEFEFQCAGSLVSNNHIVTAAHCFQLDSGNVPQGAILVSLGRYRLRDWREKGSVNREVAEYRLHPDYNSEGSADADLAIIVLRDRVEYSATIKPICLWSSGPRLEDVVGKFGFVVGWGRDELGNPYLQEPRMTRVPIVAQEVCLWSNAQFVSFTSNRTFCAGARNGSGPCNGDSGSGLVILDPRTGRYHLRGVVSRSLLDSSTMSLCDLTQFVVYVDVAKHLDWVQQQIAT